MLESLLNINVETEYRHNFTLDK